MDSSHHCFFVTSTFLQKGWQVPKASCPNGQHASYANLYPAQEAFKLCSGDFKTTLHVFSLCKDHLSPCSPSLLLTRGWAACGLPAASPRASPCPLLNKKRCGQPTHGEGERSATSTRAPPGTQHQDQDFKRSKCIC